MSTIGVGIGAALFVALVTALALWRPWRRRRRPLVNAHVPGWSRAQCDEWARRRRRARQTHPHKRGRA